MINTKTHFLSVCFFQKLKRIMIISIVNKHTSLTKRFYEISFFLYQIIAAFEKFNMHRYLSELCDDGDIRFDPFTNSFDVSWTIRSDFKYEVRRIFFIKNDEQTFHNNDEPFEWIIPT